LRSEIEDPACQLRFRGQLRVEQRGYPFNTQGAEHLIHRVTIAHGLKYDRRFRTSLWEQPGEKAQHRHQEHGCQQRS